MGNNKKNKPKINELKACVGMLEEKLGYYMDLADVYNEVVKKMIEEINQLKNNINNNIL